MTYDRPRRGARHIEWALGLTAVFAALTGCAPKTDVSMSASVQSKYSHVWLTVQEVWFNTSATATPDDTTWQKFPLTTPVTVDLASLSGGTLASLASNLKVPAGTYARMRLLPVDPSVALTSSASAVGAKFNAEADYVDANGAAQQAQLELLNPEKGIGVTTTLTLRNDTSAVLGSTSLNSTAATTDTTADSSGAITTGTTNGATTTTPIDPISGLPETTTTPAVDSTASTTTSTSTTNTAPVSVAVTVDGIHDLVQFTYGQQTGVLFNPHATAIDVSQAGAISGSIDLTNITATSVDSSGRVGVEVIAESISADGLRHTAVRSAQVATDGTFILYPLPISSSSTATSSANSSASYDLVIHGPKIATVIVKGVPVSAGSAAASTAVAVGVVETRATTAFNLNLTAGTTPLPAGAFLNLYQTLPNSGEIPYVVEQSALDPFSRTLFSDLAVSAGTVDYGTYASGTNVTLSTVTPSQGAGVYVASAQAPLFADGALTTTVAVPGSSTATVLVTPPALTPATGGSADSLTLGVSAATAGAYDHGELILSQDGAIVQTVVIDSALAQNGGQTLLIPAMPGGGGGTSFGSAVYYVSVRAWNSRNPAGTLHRQSYTTPVDLRAGSITGLTVSVN